MSSIISGITGSKLSQLAHLDETSAEHSYHASSAHSVDEPEIYVFVLGETSRAYSYQLYGYPRPTILCCRLVIVRRFIFSVMY